jgi:hypothetical protein
MSDETGLALCQSAVPTNILVLRLSIKFFAYFRDWGELCLKRDYPSPGSRRKGRKGRSPARLFLSQFRR